jgi:hypothetical protein
MNITSPHLSQLCKCKVGPLSSPASGGGRLANVLARSRERKGPVAQQWGGEGNLTSHSSPTPSSLRRQGYIAFLDSLFVYMHDKSAESSKIHFRKLMELSAIASDDVVRKAGDLKMLLSTNPELRADSPNPTNLIADLILSIRKDCFEKSNLTLEEIRKITPFR